MEFTLQHLIIFQSFLIASIDHFSDVVITQDEVTDAIEQGDLIALIEEKYGSLSGQAVIHNKQNELNQILCGEGYDPTHKMGVKNDNNGALLLVAITNRLLMCWSENSNFFQEQQESYEDKFGV